MATATITYDASDYGGIDFDPRRAKVFATHSVNGIIYDVTGGHEYIGSATGTLLADGTGSIVVPIPSEGFNPQSWQTTVHFDVPDRHARSGRRIESAGPFTVTTSKPLRQYVAEMPVQPEYAAEVFDRLDALEADTGTGEALTALAARVDGYTDHGNVSGSVTFTGPRASHWFAATGPTTITLNGYTEGQVCSLLCFSGAADVTIAGATGFEVADGLVASAMLARGTWVTGGGGEPAVTDTTPPSAVTGLTATGGSGQVSASWTAATDAESAVSYRWRAWPTSGGATGTWTTTSSTSFTKTGLTVAGGYTVEVYAYSTGGASATATATATVTVNPFPGADAYDTFTRSGSLWASTTEGGSLTWGTTGIGGLVAGSPGNPTIASGKATGGGATVDIGQTTAVVECDYVTNTGRVSLMLGGAADGTNSVMARIFGNGELKVYSPPSGGTQIGSTVSGIALSGHFSLSYNAGTGAIEVKVDNVSKFTNTLAGLTGTRSGIECNADATMDNIAWSW